MSTETWIQPGWKHLSFDDWKHQGVKHYLGKCGGCKAKVRVSFIAYARLEQHYSQPDKCYIAGPVFDYVSDTPGAQFKKGGMYKPRFTVPCPGEGCSWRATGIPIDLGRVMGVHKPEIKCNHKCLVATRPLCECSCGGENHGAGHSL